MSRIACSRLIIVLAIAPIASSSARAQTPPTPPRWAPVEAALGRKGVMQPGDVLKFSFPRSDLTVTADGVVLKPAFALGSWLAFKDVGGGHSMAMGDLVLTEDEINPVMRALQSGGVEQTALHNHLLGESPHVMYMHIRAHGDAVKIGQTVRTALASSKTPLGTPGAPAAPSAADLDTAGIARALGVAGKLNGVVYQVAIPRRERIRDGRYDVPPSMGMATAINFQPTGAGKAAISGDFVMRGREVNSVIRTLQRHDIAVASIHSHMLDEEPRLYFMHFWANADAVTLANGLAAALNVTNSKRDTPK